MEAGGGQWPHALTVERALQPADQCLAGGRIQSRRAGGRHHARAFPDDPFPRFRLLLDMCEIQASNVKLPSFTFSL